MPRIDRSMLKGLEVAKYISADRTIKEEGLKVTVLTDELIFDRFVDSVYDAIAIQWETVHPGGDFPVTKDQLKRYAYTAVRTRVARVNNERFHIRCDEAWTLPAPLAAVLAGLGKVVLEQPIMEIHPDWDGRHDDKLLSREEWEQISRRLRAVEKDENCKFVFAHAIEGGKTGDEGIMCLIPIRDQRGRLVQLQGSFGMDIDPIAAVAYLILGLEPQDAEGLALPTHALRSSPWSFRAQALLTQLDKFAEASVG